jgi:hypothetical protein
VRDPLSAEPAPARERWGPVCGIAFAVLLLLTLMLTAGGMGETDEEIVAHWGDRGNRARAIAVFFLLVAAALCFVWFAASLCGRLRGAPASWQVVTGSFGAALASATLLVAAAALWAGLAAAAGRAELELDPSLARVVASTGYVLFAASGMAAAPFVAAASLLALRSGIFPRVLASAGLPVAAGLLAAILFVPLLAFWAWIAGVSVALLRAAPRGATNRGVTQPPAARRRASS